MNNQKEIQKAKEILINLYINLKTKESKEVNK
jgi:hypothetical protein